MGEFFKSSKFKILAVVLSVLIAVMFLTAYLGGRSSPVSQVVGIVAAPFRKLSSSISGAATDFFERYLSAERLYDENEALKGELRSLREKLVDLDSYKKDNEHYRQYLDIKDKNPTFTFEPAQVIGRDPNDRFFDFTVDKGSLDGVMVHSPVITPDGLVGWVSEVGLNFSKVSTILDVSMDVGAISSRTRDIGVITGEVALAREGLCKLSYLPRESTIEKDDLIITSGLGGVFPKGLIVGTVLNVETEKNGISKYAVVAPTSDIRTISDVFLITSFSGQGNDTAVAPPEAPLREPQEGSSSGSSSSESSSSESSSSSSAVNAALPSEPQSTPTATPMPTPTAVPAPTATPAPTQRPAPKLTTAPAPTEAPAAEPTPEVEPKPTPSKKPSGSGSQSGTKKQSSSSGAPVKRPSRFDESSES